MKLIVSTLCMKPIILIYGGGKNKSTMLKLASSKQGKGDVVDGSPFQNSACCAEGFGIFSHSSES